MRLTGLRIALIWTATRLLLVYLLFTGEVGVLGDVNHFADELSHLHAVGPAHTLIEYPAPAAAVVGLPWLIANLLGSPDSYGFFLLAGALAADGIFTAWLTRNAGGRRRSTAVGFWLAALPLLGQSSIVRFDLLVGMLAAAPLLVVSRSERAGSGLLALATGIKLWPALLVPGLVARARGRGRFVTVLLGAGFVLAGSTVALGGWSRLVSPLRYQAHRGLQIESVAATPVMVARSIRAGSWSVDYSRFKSFDVSGPWVPAFLVVSAALTILLGLFLVVAWLRALRGRRRLSVDALVWLSLAGTLGFVVASKVLSPQYLLWVLPMVAVGLILVTDTYGRLVWWGLALLGATALTQLVYPLLYRPLVEAGPGLGWATLVLAVRNLLLACLAVQACRIATKAVRDGAQEARQASLGRDEAGIDA